MKKPTIKDYTTARKMRQSGMTIPEIAVAMNRTVGSLSHMFRLMIKWGQVEKFSRGQCRAQRMSPAHWEVKRLREQGMTYPEIAARIGRSKRSVALMAYNMIKWGELAPTTSEHRKRIGRRTMLREWYLRKETSATVSEP